MFIKKKLAFKSFWVGQRGKGSGGAELGVFIVLLYKSGNDTVTNCKRNQFKPILKLFFYELQQLYIYTDT